MPGQAALGGFNPARQGGIARRSFRLLPQRFRLSRQRPRGAFTFGQLFRGAARDLRIRPRAAGAEIKAENASDDAIHIAGNGIREAKRLGEQQQGQADHADNQRQQGAHRAFRQGKRQVTQAGQAFRPDGGIGHQGEAARREPPQESGKADADKENHHTNQGRQTGGAGGGESGE